LNDVSETKKKTIERMTEYKTRNDRLVEDNKYLVTAMEEMKEKQELDKQMTKLKTKLGGNLMSELDGLEDGEEEESDDEEERKLKKRKSMIDNGVANAEESDGDDLADGNQNF
jgi:hypothetical protein